MLISTRDLIVAEVTRARKKHPQVYFAALVEEVGEVAEATMKHGSMSARAREELVQVAATAVRLLEEGDPLHEKPVEKITPSVQQCQCPTCVGHAV